MSESRGDHGVAVQLGGREYRLVPQKIGRIRRRLSAVVEMFGTMQGGLGSVDEGVDEIGGVLHEGLQVFIPDLAPLYELAGYASEDAYKARSKWESERDEARQAFASEVLGLDEADDRAGAWDDLDDDAREGFEFPAFDDPYDEAADKSPTPPEIINAIETIFQIHGGQRLVRLLKSVVDPTAIKAIVRSEMLRVASGRSRISPSTNGGSDSTSSSTTPPTPETPESAD